MREKHCAEALRDLLSSVLAVPKLNQARFDNN
jgi:hypothetical protein